MRAIPSSPTQQLGFILQTRKLVLGSSIKERDHRSHGISLSAKPMYFPPHLIRLWVGRATIITFPGYRKGKVLRKMQCFCSRLLRNLSLKRAEVNNLTLIHAWLNAVNCRQRETSVAMLVPKERKQTKPLQFIPLNQVCMRSGTLTLTLAALERCTER